MSMPSGKQGPSSPFARAVADEVRMLMIRHQISAARLAPLIDVSQTYLSKRLRHEVPLTLNDVDAICAALGEDAKALIARSGNRGAGDE